jgi:5'-deoxynucleotidase
MIQNLHPYDILALGSVVRWHTLRTARAQTLADHKARVALLAVWLGHRLPVGRFEAHVELALLRLALLHDIPETQFGDVPNPSKQTLNRLETMDYDAVVDGVFWQARGVENPMATAHNLPLSLLKIADVLEAAAFYWTEGLTMRRPGTGHLPTAIVREALVVVQRELPELLNASEEVLAAADVPENLLEQLRGEQVA